MESSKKELSQDEAIKKMVDLMDLHIGRGALKLMKKYSDLTFQMNVTTGFTETHGSMRLRSIRMAQEFINRGIGRGDVVMLCGNNNDDTSVPVLASLYLGAVVLPLPATMVHGELKAMVTMGLPKIVFCDLEVAPLFKAVLKELEQDIEIIILGESPSDFTPMANLLKPTGTEEDFQVVDLEPTTTAFIICSSGTTGLPKGICITHRGLVVNLFFAAGNVNDWEQPEFKTFVSSPLFWLSGVFGYVSSFLRGHTRLYTPLTGTAEIAFDVIYKFKPEFVMLSPNVVMEILNHPEVDKCDFSEIKTFACIGSVISHDKILELQARMPKGRVVNTYGLTETTGVVGIPGENHVPNSCGKFVPWVKFKIVDPATDEVLGANQTGEVCLKSDYTLFTGYYRNPEATQQAFDKDGWFRTGDLMYHNEELNFFFVDRIKEMFKYKNQQIVPCELEDVIRRLPGVHEVCIVGVPQTNDSYSPKAFVQLVPGAKVTAEDVKNIVKENLSEYKQIREGVVFMDKLPITHSGKINRKAINAMKLTVVGS